MAVSIVTFALATAWPMASSLADLKASSHSLQTQQNIDLNPKKLSYTSPKTYLSYQLSV